MSGFISGLSQITQVATGVNQAVNAANRLSADVGSLLGGGIGGGAYAYMADPLQAGSWITELQPASWRGVPFGVISSQYTAGRRVSVHEYPGRNVPWVEDMGRATRVISFSGFVVGDDVYAQARHLLGACEQKGYGTLIHPTLGRRTVALVSPVTAVESAEDGRAVRLSFQFVETLGPTSPTIATDSSSGISLASATAFLGIPTSFASGVVGVVSQGAAAVQGAVRTVSGFVSTASRLVGDARLVVHAVSGLVAPTGSTFGRYALGGRSGPLSALSTVQSTLAGVVTATSAVRGAASSAVSLVESL